LTPQGIALLDVYVGEAGVLTGSMRVAHEARERAEEEDSARDAAARRRASERRRRVLEAQIAALEADLQSEQEIAERDGRRTRAPGAPERGLPGDGAQPQGGRAPGGAGQRTREWPGATAEGAAVPTARVGG
jgi:hypothetical protein